MLQAEECEETLPETPPLSFSCKDRLMGFKGTWYNDVANGAHNIEEETLLFDLIDQEWKIAEPSEELKSLMGTYPVMHIA